MARGEMPNGQKFAGGTFAPTAKNDSAGNWTGWSGGRFLSVDPGASDLRRPRSWNRYAYAENNPVKNVDPDGRLTNPVNGEQGQGKPILHRGGGFGQIRKEQPNVKGSAGASSERVARAAELTRV